MIEFTEVLSAAKGFAGAPLPWVRRWLSRPLIVQNGDRNYWSFGKNGSDEIMCFNSSWLITNDSSKPIKIVQAKITKPQLKSIQTMVMVKGENGMFGSYVIPPHSITELSADFYTTSIAAKKNESLKLNITFKDNFGQKRKIKEVVFEGR